MSSVRVRVPAKVNLHLSVGALRADGYHELRTVFHAVDLLDEVTASRSGGLSLSVSGRGADVLPVGAENLAWRAAALLAEATGVPPDVHLEVHKAIPVAGGMAGGSADAAGALLACARLWDVAADLADLGALAARLGSDVAFPLVGGTALGTGRGEVLSAVPVGTRLVWVFAFAHEGISTPAAYAELDRLRAAGEAPAPIGSPDALLAALAAGDLDAIAAGLGNDLQPAALAQRPALRDTLDVGLDSGALGGLVSGSGPTCAFLCRDVRAAEQVATRLRAAAVCRDAVVASGPVPGAEVIG